MCLLDMAVIQHAEVAERSRHYRLPRNYAHFVCIVPPSCAALPAGLTEAISTAAANVLWGNYFIILLAEAGDLSTGRSQH